MTEYERTQQIRRAWLTINQIDGAVFDHEGVLGVWLHPAASMKHHKEYRTYPPAEGGDPDMVFYCVAVSPTDGSGWAILCENRLLTREYVPEVLH